jgi:electron transport complex protein RnfD
MSTNTEQLTENPTYKLDLTSSPHVHSRWNTKQAMWLVVAALIPSLIAGIISFGLYQLLIIGVSVIFCLGTEYAVKSIRKRKATLTDGSAVITGLLLGLILPPNFSLSSTALGAIFAIAIGKEIFGGLGYNIFNPALIGRAFLQAAFPVQMTTWTKNNLAVDTVTSATPLAFFKFDHKMTDFLNMFLGNTGGSIGETSAIAILIGGVFLIAIGIVNYRVPLAMFLSMLVFGGLVFAINPAKYPSPLFHMLAGGFMFGTFFMATDWVTSPITGKGMWIYGVGISIVVVVIRVFGGLPEGMMYAILFMNAFVPLINRYTKPRIFGEVK